MLHVFVAFSIICQPVRKLPQRPLVATMLRSGIMGHPSFDLYQKLSTAWKGRDPGLGLDAAAGVALPPGRTSISVDAGWLFFFWLPPPRRSRDALCERRSKPNGKPLPGGPT